MAVLLNEYKKIQFMIDSLVLPFLKSRHPKWRELIRVYLEFLDEHPLNKSLNITDNVDANTMYSELLDEFLNLYFKDVVDINKFGLNDDNKRLFISLSKLIGNLKATKTSYGFFFNSFTDFSIPTDGGDINVDDMTVTLEEKPEWWLTNNDPTRPFTYIFKIDNTNLSNLKELIKEVHPAGWIQLFLMEVAFEEYMTGYDCFELDIHWGAYHNGKWDHDGLMLIPDGTSAEGETWAQHLDDTEWTPNSSETWDGDSWESYDGGPGGHVLRLFPIGGWETGYRPDKVRVTFNETANTYFALGIIDSDGGLVLSVMTDPASGAEYDLTFTGYDIAEITLNRHGSGAELSVTNIEFLSTEVVEGGETVTLYHDGGHTRSDPINCAPTPQYFGSTAAIQTSTISVFVPGELQFTLQPEGGHFVSIPGDDTFIFTASATPNPIGWQWYANLDGEGFVALPGEITDTLTITGADDDDTGIYYVEVTNGGPPTISDEVYFAVTECPIAFSDNFDGANGDAPDITRWSLVGASPYNPDDSFIGGAGSGPDVSKWKTFNVYEISDTSGINVPLLNGNRLNWSGIKAGEGSGEEAYQTISKWVWPSDESVLNAQVTFDYDTWDTTGVGTLSPMKFGYTNLRYGTEGGLRAYAYVTGNSALRELNFFSHGAQSTPFDVTDSAYWPLKVRMKRWDDDISIICGFQFYNNVLGQWQDDDGNVDQYWEGAARASFNSFLFFEFSTVSDADNTFADFVGGFSDFTVITGNVYPPKDGDEHASDDFNQADGPVDLNKWADSGIVVSSNRVDMRTSPTKYLSTKRKFMDDYDVQFDYEIPVAPGNENDVNDFEMGIRINHGEPDAAYLALTWGGGSTIHAWSLVFIGSNGTANTHAADLIGKLRFKRIGRRYETWIYYNLGWDLVHARNDVPYFGDRSFQIYSISQLDYNPDFQIWMDNFVVNSGELLGWEFTGGETPGGANTIQNDQLYQVGGDLTTTTSNYELQEDFIAEIDWALETPLAPGSSWDATFEFVNGSDYIYQGVIGGNQLYSVIHSNDSNQRIVFTPWDYDIGKFKIVRNGDTIELWAWNTDDGWVMTTSYTGTEDIITEGGNIQMRTQSYGVYDDNFTGTNGDPPNPSKWTVDVGSPVIFNNRLHMTTDPTCEIRTLGGLSGDFDVSIDVDNSHNNPQKSSDRSWFSTLYIETTDGYYCDLNFGAISSSFPYLFYWYNIWLGDHWGANGTTESAPPEGAIGKMRCARIGSTVYLYAWNSPDGDIGWNLVSTQSGFSSEDTISIKLKTFNGSPYYPVYDIYLDNFKVTSGIPIQNVSWDNLIVEGSCAVEPYLGKFESTASIATDISDVEMVSPIHTDSFEGVNGTQPTNWTAVRNDGNSCSINDNTMRFISGGDEIAKYKANFWLTGDFDLAWNWGFSVLDDKPLDQSHIRIGGAGVAIGSCWIQVCNYDWLTPDDSRKAYYTRSNDNNGGASMDYLGLDVYSGKMRYTRVGDYFYSYFWDSTTNGWQRTARGSMAGFSLTFRPEFEFKSDQAVANVNAWLYNFQVYSADSLDFI